MGRDIGDPFDIGVHMDICVLIFFISVFMFFVLVIVSFNIGVSVF